jgi:hypothetical protein
MLGSSFVVAQLVASQEGVSSMKLTGLTIKIKINMLDILILHVTLHRSGTFLIFHKNINEPYLSM